MATPPLLAPIPDLDLDPAPGYPFASRVGLVPEAEPGPEPARPPDPGRRGRVIGVIGGRGGAGASVLAAALARTAARMRRRCVLIDVDPLGGGSDLLLGAEDEPGLRWPDLAHARGLLEPGLLLEGLPVIDGVRVLAWGREAPAMVPVPAIHAVLDAAVRETDVVLVDLPRSFDPATGAAALRCHLGLLVVPAEVRAAAAARQMAALTGNWIADLRLVVRGPAPTGLTADRIADALNLPLAGDLRPEPGLGPSLDRGEPPALNPRGPLSRFTREFLAEPGLVS